MSNGVPLKVHLNADMSGGGGGKDDVTPAIQTQPRGGIWRHCV